MSDRCHVSVTCLKSDQDALTALLGGADEVSSYDEDFVELVYYEADGGLTTDREKAAKQGIAFFGSHSAGIEYGPYVFASHIGIMLENEVSTDGNLLIEDQFEYGAAIAAKAEMPAAPPAAPAE